MTDNFHWKEHNSFGMPDEENYFWMFFFIFNTSRFSSLFTLLSSGLMKCEWLEINLKYGYDFFKWFEREKNHRICDSDFYSSLCDTDFSVRICDFKPPDFCVIINVNVKTIMFTFALMSCHVTAEMRLEYVICCMRRSRWTRGV